MKSSEKPSHPTSSSASLEIIFLGGCGEFGLNCTLLRFGGEILVVDAGLMFPEEEFLGVDFVIPDIQYLFEHAKEVRGILLTHGHEDHIGASPYLYEAVRAPLYGSDFTLGLVQGKLIEHRIDARDHLRPVKARDVVQIGPFQVEFIQVTHSIPASLALAIRTPVGLVIHTADFKIDQSPVDGRLFDFPRLGQFGDEGVLALLSDSTNSEREGFTPSERRVGEALEPILRRARGRVLVTTFASHIHRIQQLLDIAEANKKRVCLVGRSLLQNTKVAERLGYLSIPPGILVEPKSAARIAPERLILVVTGSQGEPRSALSRIALDEHKEVKIGEGDQVIFSARTIPGNDKAISRVINHLLKRGAEVMLDESSPNVHASGHASQEELKIMLNLTRPKYFIPIHGEYRQLHRHARLAGESGIPQERIFLVEDGDRLVLSSDRVARGGRVSTGRVFIDTTLEEVEEVLIRDRRHLSEDGIVTAVLVINKATGEVESDPEIVSRGFVLEEEENHLLQRAGDVARSTVASSTLEERGDTHVIHAKIQADLKRFFRKETGRRPMIIPIVIEI
ncbi:MAG TPA: ribonuclease J [Candidatus Polarisedimenticolia bacterium]|nr:ribonuclease J [Candidatus Polarisedimenticolia bacterium]